MAALDFPASPVNGQQFSAAGGIVYMWDGAKWITQGVGGTLYLPLAGGQLTGAVGAIPGSPPNAAIFFGSGNTGNGLYGSGTLVGVMFGGQAKLTVDGTGTFSQNPITLPGAPTLAAHAATKAYVDGFLPLTGGDLTSAFAVKPASGPAFMVLNKPLAATYNIIYGQMNSVSRWGIFPGDNTAESGSNAGSNFVITRYNDAGASTGTPFQINRANGLITMTGDGVGVFGNGQTSSWSTTGAKGGSIAVVDVGGTAGSGGAVEFGAANGSWLFAAIKGAATDGSGNSAGSIEFYVRPVVTDPTLTVKGTVGSDGKWYNASASWLALSDRSIKENISPYENGLAAIKGLEPVTFDYIEGGHFGSGEVRHIGLIAQDAEAFIPECIGSLEVDQMTDNPKSIATLDPGPLLYTLVNAVKELATRVEQLEGTPTP